MENINYCLVIPDSFSTFASEGSKQWYALYSEITRILKEKKYSDEPYDICSTDLYKENDNLILRFKAVPARATTGGSYPYHYALIINSYQVVQGG